MNNDATLNDNAGPYKGLDRFAARQKIVEDLQNLGLLEKIEDYSHAVGDADRGFAALIITKRWHAVSVPLAHRWRSADRGLNHSGRVMPACGQRRIVSAWDGFSELSTSYF